MSEDFEQFSRRLDEEWRRERFRTLLPPPVAPSEPAMLLDELDRADPLARFSARPWLVALREAFQMWPARFAFVSVACAILVIGFALGHVTTGPSASRVAVGPIPPTPVAKPDYKPDIGRSALAIGSSVKPESEKKFREAMAFHNTPEFAARALPLLQQSVALDSNNDQAQFWLGVALLLEDKTAEAISPLEDAVRLAPRSTPYKQYMVFAYLRNGEIAKALRVQNELLKQP
jgi:tetratricopeptide (TPR) repeat protein